mgnify:CR=1 FL=1
MRLLQKPFLYAVASVALGVAPVALIVASSFARGAEGAVLTAIGFSPVWAGMLLSSYLLMESSRRRARQRDGR